MLNEEWLPLTILHRSTFAHTVTSVAFRRRVVNTDRHDVSEAVMMIQDGRAATGTSREVKVRANVLLLRSKVLLDEYVSTPR